MFESLSLIPLLKATFETVYMVFIASLISIGGGMLVGITLFLTREKQALECKWLNSALGFIVNATRSVPFIILMISVLPLTRLLAGTTIGVNAAIVPLAFAAIPFFARICESAFSEIPYGLIETAYSLGANTQQLVRKILIPESLPALIRGMSLTVIGLIGYSAMAGAVGGGGLGELAINYGYQRFDAVVTIETVLILIVIVQAVQTGGDILAKKRQIKPLLWMSAALAIGCLLGHGLIHSAGAFPLGAEKKELKIGIMPGWSEDVMKIAGQEAEKKYGFKIKPVIFHDYVLPNTALAQGSIDANIFQHVPYLNVQNKAQNYDLVPLSKTFVYPLGFFSHKVKEAADLPHKAVIAIPNDPSNEARSLLLLEKAGLISLKPKVGALAGVKDITSNPKQFQFKLLDAAQLPRVLKDADLVALTNDYVKSAGFTIQDALLKEGADSLYANVIVVRKEDQNKPVFQDLIKVMHSEPVLKETQKTFPHGAAIPAW